MQAYLDSKGLPLTLAKDGGDSAATAGNLLVTRGPTSVSIWPYINGDEPVRYPDSSKWYGRPGRFSRDQLVALLCGVTLYYYTLRYVRERLFEMHSRRFLLFAWNCRRNHVYEGSFEHLQKSTPDVKWDIGWKTPDFCGPNVWALWIRAFRFWFFWPLLVVFDLDLLVNALLWRYVRKDNVTRNHLLEVHVANQVMCTPTSLLAKSLTPVSELKARWKKHCELTGELYTMDGVCE